MTGETARRIDTALPSETDREANTPCGRHRRRRKLEGQSAGQMASAVFAVRGFDDSAVKYMYAGGRTEASSSDGGPTPRVVDVTGSAAVIIIDIVLAPGCTRRR